MVKDTKGLADVQENKSSEGKGFSCTPKEMMRYEETLFLLFFFMGLKLFSPRQS